MAKTPSSSTRSPHLIVKKPISVLQREVKAEFAGLFKTLGKSIAHLATGKYEELAADLGEAAAAMGLKADPGGLAWLLIRRSLLRAMHTLTGEAWLHRQVTEGELDWDLADRLDEKIDAVTLQVNADFFRKPGSLSLLEDSKKLFEEWLVGICFDSHKAASIADRLQTYFVYALNQEWREHADLYAPITAAADTPFTQAGERERAWEQYRAWLARELDDPLFGEPFSLRQLYVPLRAYYVEGRKGLGDLPSEREAGSGNARVALDLTSALLGWAKQSDRDDAFRVISGGPGSGKSSVAKMLTAEMLENASLRALYVPLHRIKYKGEIVPAVEDYLRDTGLLPGHSNPLDRELGDSQLLIIFDGLDELAMLGKIAQETASQFVRAVKDLVRDYNTVELRLKVILTGRTLILQSLESEFRKDGAVLHLCPYFVSDREEARYKSGWEILGGQDQRQQWWSVYGQLTGQEYRGLPKHFDRADLVEVSSEPLLNYLLALANQTSTLDFSRPVTQNQIYGSLVHELYERRWAGGENFAVRGMSEDHFHRVLEEIAIAAWHGDGRKTTVGEIKQHVQDAGITTMLETFQEGAESGVLRLLTAFFFRQAGVRADENAFEFTHKSFGEYLVARRIVRMVEIIRKKSDEQRNEFTGWDERKCLEEWARLCGPSPLTERQWEFLRNEMHMQAAAPATWQPLLSSLMSALLRHGIPMERLGLLNFRSMCRNARNAEEGLLLTLNACARVTRTRSVIAWPEATSAGEMISRLQGQRNGPVNALAMSALCFLDLSQQCFDLADLYAADLRGSSLDQLAGQSMNLWRANLSGASLKKARLNDTNLRQAHLVDADLREVVLAGANLHQADMRRANLRSAHLQGAKLTKANLQSASLDGARLRRADLAGAKLRSASFRKANLHAANLGGAATSGLFKEADFTESGEDARERELGLQDDDISESADEEAEIDAAEEETER